MEPTLLDRAATLLNATGRVLVPVPELAEALGVDGSILLPRLRGDDRFLLIQPAAFPDLTPLPEADRDAYAMALQAAGVYGATHVALANPEPGTSPGSLLRYSVARLLVREAEPGLASSAELVGRLMAQALEPDDGTDPSTTPPPGPR